MLQLTNFDGLKRRSWCAAVVLLSVFASDRKRCDALLHAAELFGLCRKNGSQTFVAGTNSATPYKECSELDAAGCAERYPPRSHLLSPDCPGRAPCSRSSSGKKSL